MGATEVNAGDLLRAAGWRQGSILDQKSLLQLGAEGHDIAIVLSHDCDVVRAVMVEPSLELILGSKAEKPRPEYLYGRNPREIDLLLADGVTAIRLCANERISVSKEKLCNLVPSSDVLEFDSVSLLAKWIAKRYTRAAWPDAFIDRLRRVDRKLDQLFKSIQSRQISSILIMLEPPRMELPANEDYRMVVWLTVPVASRMDESCAAAAQDFESQLKGILSRCPGIKLEEIETRSEADVSMDDLRQFRNFDRDYRSVAPSPGGYLPPSED